MGDKATNPNIQGNKHLKLTNHYLWDQAGNLTYCDLKDSHFVLFKPGYVCANNYVQNLNKGDKNAQ